MLCEFGWAEMLLYCIYMHSITVFSNHGWEYCGLHLAQHCLWFGKQILYVSLTHSRFEKWAWWISPAAMMISNFFFLYLILFSGFLPLRQGPSLCRQNPCLNGGVCATNTNLDSFDCVCPDGFTGALCEKSEWNTVK